MNTAELTPAGELTAEELGSVHLIGIGGVGMGGLARLLLTRGMPVSGSELREWPALAGAARARRHGPHEPRGVQPRRRRHGRLLDRDPAGPPGAGRGAPARAAGAAPLRGAGRGDDRPADDRGRRHPRQDHHHVDDDADPAARRAGPVVRDRRRDLRGRLQRPPRHRRATSWPRPTRATGRSCSTGRTSRSSPTSTATTSTTTATWPGSRPAFARVRASSPTPDGFVVTCADDPGTRRADRGAARRRAAPVYTYGEARRRRPADHRRRVLGAAGCATWPRWTASRSARSSWRCPAGTWA